MKARTILFIILLLALVSIASVQSSIKYESYMYSSPYGSDTPQGNVLKGHGDTTLTLYPLVRYAAIDYGSFKQEGFYQESEKELIIYTGLDSVQRLCKLKNGDVGMQLVGNLMMSFRKI